MCRGRPVGNRGEMPTPEELAAIEDRKRECREQHFAEMAGRPPVIPKCRRPYEPPYYRAARVLVRRRGHNAERG